MLTTIWRLILMDFENALLAALPGVRSFLRSRTGDESLADDILHATVESALRDREKFELGTNLAAWLVTIAKNTLHNHRKSAHVRCAAPLPENYAELVPADLASPDTRRELEQVWACVEALPEFQRDALKLSAEGFSYKEIADLLDSTDGSVSVTLARVRKKLAGLFRSDC